MKIKPFWQCNHPSSEAIRVTCFLSVLLAVSIQIQASTHYLFSWILINQTWTEATTLVCCSPPPGGHGRSRRLLLMPSMWPTVQHSGLPHLLNSQRCLEHIHLHGLLSQLWALTSFPVLVWREWSMVGPCLTTAGPSCWI